MKKNRIILIIVFSILIHMLCGVAPAGAVPSFGTVMPERGKWIAGVQANYTFKRDVRDYSNVGSSQYFYNLSFGFSDWFSFDAKLGIGSIKAKPLNAGEYNNYRANFAGGYGCRARLFEETKSKIKTILGFEHISVHPSGKNIASERHDIIWDDWQAHLTAFREFGNIYPYCGMRGSLLYIIRKISGNRTRRHSGDYLGLVVGTDVKMNEYVYMSVEGRFFDESALSTGITIKY
jgi:hypothetical protein